MKLFLIFFKKDQNSTKKILTVRPHPLLSLSTQHKLVVATAMVRVLQAVQSGFSLTS
jgi:hypothetical protein